MVPANLRINLRTKFSTPSTDRSCLIVLGVGKSTIAFTRSSPIRIQSAVSMCPKSYSSSGPNGTFACFSVKPTASNASHM